MDSLFFILGRDLTDPDHIASKTLLATKATVVFSTASFWSACSNAKKSLSWVHFSNVPANEAGGQRCHCVYHFACKNHFQVSNALTCESKMSVFSVKSDCCNLAYTYSSLLNILLDLEFSLLAAWRPLNFPNTL